MFCDQLSNLHNKEMLSSGCVYVYIYIYIYIYICVCNVLNPVNLKMGIIPSRTNNRILNLSNPGQELNVNKINRTNNILLKKNLNNWSH